MTLKIDKYKRQILDLVRKLQEKSQNIDNADVSQEELEEFRDALIFVNQEFTSQRDILFNAFGELESFDIGSKIKTVDIFRSIGNLSQTLFTYSKIKIEMVPVEEWAELSKHIVLVHGFSYESLAANFPEESAAYFNDKRSGMVWALKKALNQDGSLGDQNYGDRPHIHWAWNQLVQSHKFGNWEECQFAVLEPLGTFEETIPPFGCASFDTMTIGRHWLSRDAILLIPKKIAHDVEEHLNDGFRGKIVPYEYKRGRNSLRQAIYENLKEHYPNVWHLIDPETEKEIAPKVHRTDLGFPNITCLGGCDEYFFIQQGEGNDDSDLSYAMQEVKNSGRFIGLHARGATCWLEDKSYFKALMKFSKEPDSIKDNNFFVGSEESELGILEALAFYQKMNTFDKRTRSKDLGEYILNLAFQADITSILFSQFSDCPLFTPHELSFIVYSHQEQLFNLIGRLEEETEEGVEAYVHFLTQAIKCMLEANEMIKTASFEVAALPHFLKDFLEGKTYQREWEFVLEEDLDVDFDKRWPLRDREQELIIKIRQDLQFLDLESIQGTLCLVRKIMHEESEAKNIDYLEYILEVHLKEGYYSQFHKKY